MMLTIIFLANEVSLVDSGLCFVVVDKFVVHSEKHLLLDDSPLVYRNKSPALNNHTA